MCSCVSWVRVRPPRSTEVHGEIVQTIYNVDGSIQSDTKALFTVFVRDCAWLIHSTDLDKVGRPVVARETGCINGSEIYEVVGDEEDGKVGTSKWKRNWNLASIVSNGVPVGHSDNYFVCHLWLMFASGCYFAGLSSNWLTPAYDVNAYLTINPDLKQESKWQLANGPGSLPVNVVYLADGDFTNATYVSTGITNVGGTQLASGFVFEQRLPGLGFAPGPLRLDRTGAQYRIRRRAVATVTFVRAFCSRSNLLPEARGATLVVDHRLPAAERAKLSTTVYRLRNGVKC